MGVFKPTLSKILLGLILGGVTWQLGSMAGFFAAGNQTGSLAYYLVYIFAPTSLLTFRFMNGVHERLDNILYYLFVIGQFLYGYVLACLASYVKKVFGQR